MFLSRRGSSGFLLLEGMVVAAALAVFAILAVPQAVRMYREALLEYEAVQLLHTIRHVQALSRNAAAWPEGMAPQRGDHVPLLRFSRTGYMVMRGRREVVQSHTFPEGMTMVSSISLSHLLRFDPQGIIDVPFSLRLRMEGCARERQIVLSLSGRCRLDRVG